jgi:hypothetical protein
MAIVRGQKSTLASTASAATLPTSWGTSPAAGSTVLVFIQVQSGFSITSVVDNGTTVRTFVNDTSTLAGEGAYIFRANNVRPPTGTYSVTVNLSGSTTITLMGIAYAGVVAGPPRVTNAGGATGTAVTTNAVSGAGESLYFAGFSDASGLAAETITYTGNGTEQGRVTNGSTFWCCALSDVIDVAGGSKSETWTLGDSVAWGSVIAVYDADNRKVAFNPVPFIPQGRSF